LNNERKVQRFLDMIQMTGKGFCEEFEGLKKNKDFQFVFDLYQ